MEDAPSGDARTMERLLAAATRFEFYPPDTSRDDEEAYLAGVSVEWRGPGDTWAIAAHSFVLSRGGTWSFEPSPSHRSDAFKERTRFTLAEALELVERLHWTDAAHRPVLRRKRGPRIHQSEVAST